MKKLLDTTLEAMSELTIEEKVNFVRSLMHEVSEQIKEMQSNAQILIDMQQRL